MIYREVQTTLVLADDDGGVVIVDEIGVFEVVASLDGVLNNVLRETVYVPNPLHQGRVVAAILTGDAKLFLIQYEKARLPIAARVMPRGDAHRLAMLQLATTEESEPGSPCEICRATGEMCRCPTCTNGVCATHLTVLVQCSTCRELRESQLADFRDWRQTINAANQADAATRPEHERTGPPLSGGAE